MEDGQSVSRRLETIKRVQERNTHLGLHLFKILAAQVQGDARTFSLSEYEELVAYATEHGISIPSARLVVSNEETENRPPPIDDESDLKEAFDGAPLFAENASPLQIIAWIRGRKKYLSQTDDLSRFIIALGNCIARLIDDNNQQEAMRIVRYTARHFSFGTAAAPMAQLAKQLEERGYADIAAATWALAYSRSRGGYGWLTLGGVEYIAWVKNGLKLSVDNTLQTIASEVASLLHGGAHFGIAGHLVEMCTECVSNEIALGVWDAAYQVLHHRLPGKDSSPGRPFKPYNPSTSPLWTIDDALFYLLLARVSHPELKRKAAAIAGCAWIVKSFPGIAIAGLRQALSRETPSTSMLTMLQIVAEFEQAPFLVSKALRDALLMCSTSELFGIRWLASMLLERIGERTNIQPSSSNSSLFIPASQDKLEMLHYLDRGDRVESIAEIWPSFPANLSGYSTVTT